MTPSSAKTAMPSTEMNQVTPRTSNRIFDFLVTPDSMAPSMYTESSRVTDTPVAESTQTAAAGKNNTEKQREMVLCELARHTVETEATWATTLYTANLTDKTAEKYLSQSKLYTGGSWAVPTTSSEKELYRPFANIIKDIMKHFGYDDKHGRRVCVDIPMTHLEDEETDQISKPDITIIADDPCIRGSGLPEKPTYQTAIACWDVKLDQHMGNIKEQKGQMGVYARYVLLNSLLGWAVF
jgi:hypothetical protein